MHYLAFYYAKLLLINISDVGSTLYPKSRDGKEGIQIKFLQQCRIIHFWIKEYNSANSSIRRELQSQMSENSIKYQEISPNNVPLMLTIEMFVC